MNNKNVIWQELKFKLFTNANYAENQKMYLISYDPIHHGYLSVGKRTDNAFTDGKQLK